MTELCANITCLKEFRPNKEGNCIYCGCNQKIELAYTRPLFKITELILTFGFVILTFGFVSALGSIFVFAFGLALGLASALRILALAFALVAFALFFAFAIIGDKELKEKKGV